MLDRHEREIEQCVGRSNRLEDQQWVEWLVLLARHRREAGQGQSDTQNQEGA